MTKSETIEKRLESGLEYYSPTFHLSFIFTSFMFQVGYYSFIEKSFAGSNAPAMSLMDFLCFEA